MAKKASAHKPMEMGVLSSFSVDGSNPFDIIARYGVETTQLCNWDMSKWTDENAKKVRKDLKSSGVRLSALWTGYSGTVIWNFVDGPDTMGLIPRYTRRKRLDDLKRGADFAAKVGAPAIITHCGFIPETPKCDLYCDVLEALHEIGSYCQQLGLGFWFETGQETPVTLLRTIEDLALPNLGINLDTANIILYGKGNPVDALEVFGKYVRNLHVKDGVYPTNGNQLGHEVAVGQGKVDFKRIIPKLHELGYTGELIIEREIGGEQQAKDIMSAVKYIRSLVAKCEK